MAARLNEREGASSGTAAGATRPKRSIGQSGSHTETMRLIGPLQKQRESLRQKRPLAAALQRDGVARCAGSIGRERVGSTCLRADRQRVAVEPAAGVRGSVMSRHGVACPAAARLKRRAGVSATSLKTPMTSARLADLKPSSRTQSASVARAVSTNRQEEAAAPKKEKPCAQGYPISRASTDGQHQRMRPRAFAVAPSASKRRTASRRAKPSAAAQSPAATPAKARCGLHLVQGSRIEAAGKAMVELGHAQRPCLSAGRPCWQDVPGKFEGEARRRGARSLRCARVSRRGGSVCPLRNGEEGLAVPVRARRPKPYAPDSQTAPGLGSGREILCRQADGGVGDGAAWSKGTLSQQLGNGARGYRCVLFLF